MPADSVSGDLPSSPAPPSCTLITHGNCACAALTRAAAPADTARRRFGSEVATRYHSAHTACETIAAADAWMRSDAISSSTAP
jgi:hypothetical protein